MELTDNICKLIKSLNHHNLTYILSVKPQHGTCYIIPKSSNNTHYVSYLIKPLDDYNENSTFTLTHFNADRGSPQWQVDYHVEFDILLTISYIN